VKSQIEETGMAHLLCPVCESPAIHAGHAYYGGSVHTTQVYVCSECDCYIRELSTADVKEHLRDQGYTRLTNEQKLLNARTDFFRHILRILDKFLSPNVSDRLLVDFGSSYGHLLELAASEGFTTIGVEVNEQLREFCRQKQLSVTADLSEIGDGVADVVTMIDSLYMVTDPKQVLSEVRRMLKPGGIIFLRMTNRNWIASLRRRLGISSDLSVLGDTTVSYSEKSLTYLLQRTGFELMAVIPDGGTGKAVNLKRKAGYWILQCATAALRHPILTPGIFYVARPVTLEFPE
jgi:2-polyprenyl-3-methyl-5-hydroxy-6-metoxy-1,4-benzoquinol methylase